MRVHIVLTPEGQALGVYADGKLVAQKQGMESDDVLSALGIRQDLIVLNDEEMKRGPILPASLDEIPIDGLLGEGATIVGIKAEAAKVESVRVKPLGERAEKACRSFAALGYLPALGQAFCDLIEDCAAVIDRKVDAWKESMRTIPHFTGTYEDIELMEEMAEAVRALKGESQP